VIKTLRSALFRALGRAEPQPGRTDAERRIDDARRRLKAAIPPPPED
jgi:hypothetical protein